jgi:hypothetical protein
MEVNFQKEIKREVKISEAVEIEKMFIRSSSRNYKVAQVRKCISQGLSSKIKI